MQIYIPGCAPLFVQGTTDTYRYVLVDNPALGMSIVEVYPINVDQAELRV